MVNNLATNSYIFSNISNKIIESLIAIIKYTFFLFHFSFLLIVFFGIYFYWEGIYLQILTILSWKFNQNKCVFSQIEEYLFGETIIDLHYKIVGNNKNYIKCVVPTHKRYILYGYFILCILSFFYYNL